MISLDLRAVEIPPETVREVFLDRLERIGIECVSKVREGGTYGNVTGNLRSSIGFCVLCDGKVYRSSEPKAFKGKKGTGSGGVSQHDKVISSLCKDYSKGIYLFVFAGMHYARYVENMGFDVLTAAKALLDAL